MGEPISTGLAIASLVAGAAGTAYSASEQKKQARKAADAQEKARDVGIASTNEQAARDRRSQIREARIQRAMVQNTAAASGATGSSAPIVGGQAATAQMGQNLGNINTAMSFSRTQGIANQNVANVESEGTSLFGQLAGGVGSQLMNLGLQHGAESIFKK